MLNGMYLSHQQSELYIVLVQNHQCGYIKSQSVAIGLRMILSDNNGWYPLIFQTGIACFIGSLWGILQGQVASNWQFVGSLQAL